jgi:integrase
VIANPSNLGNFMIADTLTRLQAEVDKQRVPETAVPLSRALDEWLRTVEIEESTRRSYIGYIERVIKPVLGSVSIAKLSARSIETLYAELRRCRTRCDGRPFIERHRVLGKHDCVASRCALHVCRPMAASTVRQIHSIISGTLSAAVRWDWIATNPARVAQRPRVRAPEPSPPSPAEAARLLAAAFAMDEDWGTLVWLVTTTGIRRGEVCALRCATSTAMVRRSRFAATMCCIGVSASRRTPRPTRCAALRSTPRPSPCCVSRRRGLPPAPRI